MKKNEVKGLNSFNIMRRFTLIELLVVIAIIAILAGMLLPALGRVKETVKTTTCVNNFKQLNTYLQGYMNDYGFLPCEDKKWYGYLRMYANLPLPAYSYSEGNEQDGTFWEFGAPMVRANSDDFKDIHPSFMCSNAYKTATHQFYRTCSYGVYPWNGPYAVSRITRPSQKCPVGEHLGYQGMTSTGYWPGLSTHPTYLAEWATKIASQSTQVKNDFYRGRHDKKTVRWFADGHAEILNCFDVLNVLHGDDKTKNYFELEK